MNTYVVSSLEVREVSFYSNAHVLWNDFVDANKGTYCHQYEWRGIFHAAYRLKTYYLVITRGLEWVGIFPIALIPGISGLKAVSVPYCNYGGLLVSDSADVNQVRHAALSFLRSKGIRRLEVREFGNAKFPNANDGGVTMLLDLTVSSEMLWKQIGSKTRNQIRKAESYGLEIQWGRDQADDLYEIYAKNMGRLGTPVHTRDFIHEIIKAFGDQSDVLTIRLQGRAVAAMLILKFGSTWIDPIASSLAEFKKINSNMLLYWEALKKASNLGVHCFDLGRSQRESGTYNFKRQWGAVATPLNYHSYVDGIQVASASTDIYRSDSAAILAWLWTKLPSCIQLTFGPKIRRYIP